MQNTEEIWRLVDAKKADFEALSDRVWGMPELCYGEVRSCAEHTAMLEQHGFRVTKNVAGIPTAVMGEAGEDGPVIAILGEYDALPGLSQEAGVAEPKPLPGEGYGHGCGHNLLGSASMLAAAAVKDYLAANGIKGRVRYYGCPAEEGGAAKGFMARAGAFSDVDVAISWHPSSFSGVNEPVSLANTRIDFTFHGRASHAAAAPHLVQARAKVRYLIRARDLPELTRLIERVRKVADGAALMTETRVETQVVSAVSNLLANTPLEKAMYDNLQRIGPPPFDDADRAAAAKFQATLTDEDIEAAYRRVGLPMQPGVSLCDRIVPLDAKSAPMMGSTDVGDVSWVVPTVQARGATYAIGTPGHSWQLTAQGKMPAAHKGMVHVAKVMAGTAVDVIQDEVLLARAKADHQARIGRNPYVCPLPDDLEPPVKMSA